MELTFAEAAKGANKELSVNMDDACPRCDGKGSEPGTKVSHCHYCNGTGMVSIRSLSLGEYLQALQAPSFPLVGFHLRTLPHCVITPPLYSILLSASPPAGVDQHGSLHDAQHMSALRGEGLHHNHALRALPRFRSDQEEADGHCACTCW